MLEVNNNLITLSIHINKKSCLIIISGIVKWKVHGPRNKKNPRLYNFQTLLSKKRQGAERYV